MNTVDYIFSQVDLEKIMEHVQKCMTNTNETSKLMIYRYFSTQPGLEKNIQEISPTSNMSIQYEVDERDLLYHLKYKFVDYISANKLSDIGYFVNASQIQINIKRKNQFYKEMILEFYPNAFLPEIKIVH